MYMYVVVRIQWKYILLTTTTSTLCNNLYVIAYYLFLLPILNNNKNMSNRFINIIILQANSYYDFQTT